MQPALLVLIISPTKIFQGPTLWGVPDNINRNTAERLAASDSAEAESSETGQPLLSARRCSMLTCVLLS